MRQLDESCQCFFKRCEQHFDGAHAAMCARERERQAAHRVRNEQALDGMLHEELHDVVVPKVARYVKWDRC